MGTIGGNIVNASPAADTATPLLALGASLKLMSGSGERVVPIEAFFVNVNRTILQGNELLTEIQIPYQPPKTGAAFMKVGRRVAHDLSVVNVATVITLDDGVCKNIRIAFGSVAPTPIRAKKAEAFLKEKTLELDTLKKASEIASKEIRPISDIRASASYRKDVSTALVPLAIQKAIDRVEGREYD
jgi:carbon-monoxide dehydrogenase medium subunit